MCLPIFEIVCADAIWNLAACCVFYDVFYTMRFLCVSVCRNRVLNPQLVHIYIGLWYYGSSCYPLMKTALSCVDIYGKVFLRGRIIMGRCWD